MKWEGVSKPLTGGVICTEMLRRPGQTPPATDVNDAS